MRSEYESPAERAARIKEAADKARPYVSMTPGMAATLKSVQRRRWRYF